MAGNRNAADEQRIHQLRAAEKRQARQAKADFRAVMQTREGRAVLWAILAEAGVYRSTYAIGDAHHSAFLEGQRNGGLRLLYRMEELAPEEYQLAQREAIGREAETNPPATDDGPTDGPAEGPAEGEEQNNG